MSFIKSMLKEHETKTENGMKTYTTTENALTDFFFACGALRNAPNERIEELFEAALKEDPVIATRILFYSRDVRGGQGERKLFRVCLNHLKTINNAQVLNFIKENLHVIPHYGRWDDVLSLLNYNNELDQLIGNFIKQSLYYGDNLCAKWMPREKSAKKDLARKLRGLMRLSAKDYRKLLSKNTNVVENKMCAKEWADINFSHVPSQAFLRYRNAFRRHQEERFEQFNKDVSEGKETVNAGTLHPHQIISQCFSHSVNKLEMNNLWNNLKEFYTTDEKILPIVDVSASMNQGTPIAMHVSIALGLYISERNTGKFKNFFVTFDDNPEFCLADQECIVDRVRYTGNAPWGGSTNLEKTFQVILDKAVHNMVNHKDMPSKIIIFSDMEFNEATSSYSSEEYDYSALKMIKSKYSKMGYEMPKIIFWNLASRNKNNPVRFDQEGTALVSGFSPSIMTAILGGKDFTPYSIMMDALEKYKEKISF